MTPQALEKSGHLLRYCPADPCHFGITSSPLLLHAAFYVVPAAGPGFSLQGRCRPCRDQVDVDCAIGVCPFTRHEAVQVMTTHGFSHLGLAVVMVPQELASQKTAIAAVLLLQLLRWYQQGCRCCSCEETTKLSFTSKQVMFAQKFLLHPMFCEH